MMVYGFRMKASGVQAPISFDNQRQANNWFKRMQTKFPAYTKLLEPISIEVIRKVSVLNAQQN